MIKLINMTFSFTTNYKINQLQIRFDFNFHK